MPCDNCGETFGKYSALVILDEDNAVCDDCFDESITIRIDDLQFSLQSVLQCSVKKTVTPSSIQSIVVESLGKLQVRCYDETGDEIYSGFEWIGTADSTVTVIGEINNFPDSFTISAEVELTDINRSITIINDTSPQERNRLSLEL